MAYCIPLKKTLEFDKSIVGQRAIDFSLIEGEVKIPFSMVITTDVFDEFVKHNQLKPELDCFRNAETINERIHSFERLIISFKNAQFPEHVLDSIRECFELVSLDTNNLNNLSMSYESKNLMTLIRSCNFDDETNILNPIFNTKETFKQFIEAIKKVYMSSFNPSSILSNEPKIAIIVSRMPELIATIETEYFVSDENIFNQVYLGFPDTYNNVEKDVFVVGSSFLKVNKKSIEKQNRAIVFDSQANTYSIKEFSESKTSQTTPDGIVLETSRLAKKISRLTNSSYVKAIFLNKKDEIYCINITTKKEPINNMNNTLINETIFETDEQDKENKEHFDEKTDIILKPEEKKFKLIDLKKQYEFSNFLNSAKAFMLKYQNKQMDAVVPIMFRSLEEPTKDSLKQTLEICKDIISDFEDIEN
ncbi:MAG: PEP/pyruvate-binding domain-containing protein [Candidatus Woesearchaeota archaeon]